MKYGSVCSGIEAATVAWKSLKWEAQWFSEIEKFPCDLLAKRYPDVENLGDMTKLHTKELFNGQAIDLLVGGTPCQSFSIAGLRKGLADPRGNLSLAFLAVLERKRPRWVVWENVPGVLSSWTDEEGSFERGISSHGEPIERGWQTNDFDTFICGLKELGYGLAWRILDAQFIGVPQQRRRVFVIGYLGDWRPATAVLFECHSLSWDPPPNRKKGEGTSADVARSLRGRSNASHREDSDTYIPETANDEGQTPIVSVQPVVYENHPADSRVEEMGDGQITGALAAETGAKQQTYLMTMREGKEGGGKGPLIRKDKSGSLSTGNNQTLFSGMSVRRLTPRECERLQGFPDDYTDIKPKGKPTSDGSRYKSLGNSMATVVMHWIGKRIKMVDALIK